jgi:hypothetical protein
MSHVGAVLMRLDPVVGQDRGIQATARGEMGKTNRWNGKRQECISLTQLCAAGSRQRMIPEPHLDISRHLLLPVLAGTFLSRAKAPPASHNHNEDEDEDDKENVKRNV